MTLKRQRQERLPLQQLQRLPNQKQLRLQRLHKNREKPADRLPLVRLRLQQLRMPLSPSRHHLNNHLNLPLQHR
jgi:hypothetical protein